MNRKSPALVYVFTLLTVGVYFFIWLFSNMHELNNCFKERRFNIGKRVAIVFGVIIPYFINYYYIFNLAINTRNNGLVGLGFIIGFALTIIWFIVLIKNIRDLSKAILEIEKDKSIEKQISVEKATIFFFLYFTAIPYIQIHINKISSSIEMQ